jgi:Dolichyl-phosphate-mannose-protein mannosyltransferase
MPSTTNAPLAPPGPGSQSPYTGPFSGVGDWVESHYIFSLLILFAIYLCANLGYSLRIPLWHDEIFTWYISQAPSLRALLHLTRTIDLNPPLSYLLTRASFHLFGAGTLQTRLPEIAGFWLALVCVSLFVRRRAGSSFAILAAVILFASKTTEPAIDGRPYGLMFGFGALMLVAWQSSTMAQDRGSRSLSSDLLLAVAATALLLTHVFGLFLWAAIVAAEATQSWDRKQLTPSRLVALILPLASISLYVRIFRSHAGGSFPPAFQAHLSDIFGYYANRTTRDLESLGFTLLLIAAIGGRSWLRPASRFVLTRPEWIAVSCFLLTPVLIIARLTPQHGAFFYRYGDAAMLGTAILFTVLLCRLAANRPAVALVAAVVFLCFSSRMQHAFIFAAQGHIFRHSEPTIVPFHLHPIANSILPLIVNSGIVFMEMNNHESPELLDRTYYLTGGPVAIHYTNASIFESMPEEVQAFHLHGHSVPYADFVRQHPHFYLLAGDHDYPEDWLLRKLQADGAQMRILGNIDNSYRDHELYEVSLPSATN